MVLYLYLLMITPNYLLNNIDKPYINKQQKEKITKNLHNNKLLLQQSAIVTQDNKKEKNHRRNNKID